MEVVGISVRTWKESTTAKNCSELYGQEGLAQGHGRKVEMLTKR